MFVGGNKGQKTEVVYSKGQLVPSQHFKNRFDDIEWDEPVPGAEFTEDVLNNDET